VALLAFLVGFSGAVSLRLILIAKAYAPELIRLFWYIGVVGNMLFFLFRGYISQKRKKMIVQTRLMEKINQPDQLTQDDYNAIRYLLTSLNQSKEIWNYVVIFIFSLLAIIWDLFNFS